MVAVILKPIQTLIYKYKYKLFYFILRQPFCLSNLHTRHFPCEVRCKRTFEFSEVNLVVLFIFIVFAAAMNTRSQLCLSVLFIRRSKYQRQTRMLTVCRNQWLILRQISPKSRCPMPMVVTDAHH